LCPPESFTPQDIFFKKKKKGENRFFPQKITSLQAALVITIPFDNLYHIRALILVASANCESAVGPGGFGSGDADDEVATPLGRGPA